jgi:hypothetical protein
MVVLSFAAATHPRAEMARASSFAKNDHDQARREDNGT